MTPDDVIDALESWAAGVPVPSYDDILERWGAAFRMYRLAAWSDQNFRCDPGRDVDLYRVREIAIKRFGFFIPCKELLDACEKLAPILELGAGTGYMTQLMRHRGIDVIGTDPQIETHWFDHAVFDAQQERLQAKTAVRRYPDRNVFCAWPSLSQTWFRQALKAMRPGRFAVWVREDATADERTWDWTEAHGIVAGTIYIPAWPFLNDTAEVWRKRR